MVLKQRLNSINRNISSQQETESKSISSEISQQSKEDILKTLNSRRNININLLRNYFFSDFEEIGYNQVKNLINYLSENSLYIENFNFDLLNILNDPRMTVSSDIEIGDSVKSLKLIKSYENFSAKIFIRQDEIVLKDYNIFFGTGSINEDQLLGLLFANNIYGGVLIEIFKKIRQEGIKNVFEEFSADKDNPLKICESIESEEGEKDELIYDYIRNNKRRGFDNGEEIRGNQVLRLKKEGKVGKYGININGKVISPRVLNKEVPDITKFNLNCGFKEVTVKGSEITNEFLKNYYTNGLGENFNEGEDGKNFVFGRKKFEIEDDLDYTFIVSENSGKLIVDEEKVSLAEVEYLTDKDAIIKVYASSGKDIQIPDVGVKNLTVNYIDDTTEEGQENKEIKGANIKIEKTSGSLILECDIIDSTIEYPSSKLEVVSQKSIRNSKVISNSGKLEVKENTENSEIICEEINLNNISNTSICADIIYIGGTMYGKNILLGSYYRINKTSPDSENIFKLKKGNNQTKYSLINLENDIQNLQETIQLNLKGIKEKISNQGTEAKKTITSYIEKYYHTIKRIKDLEKEGYLVFDGNEITTLDKGKESEYINEIQKLQEKYFYINKKLGLYNIQTLAYNYTTKKVDQEYKKLELSNEKNSNKIDNSIAIKSTTKESSILYLLDGIMGEIEGVEVDIDSLSFSDMERITKEIPFEENNLGYYNKRDFKDVNGIFYFKRDRKN